MNQGPSERRKPPTRQTPGLAARQIAAQVVDGVLRQGKPLHETLEGDRAHGVFRHLNARDRALVTMLCQTSLRQLGFLRAVLARRLDKALPRRAGATEAILLVAAAQIYFLDTPAHAAVDLAVRDAAGDRNARHFRALVNAVLRAIAADREAAAEGLDALELNTPAWLHARWQRQYGAEVARNIAAAHARTPPLDLTVKSDADGWAQRLGGIVLPTGSVRIADPHGSIERLEGYDAGAWWVQDAAAALPARLLGDVAGLDVADLAAAPGGKTAQLARAGARVTAVDRSRTRMARLAENLARLKLDATTVVADIAKWQSGKSFDAVLLDAPCSATGTIRRHPDIPWLRRDGDFKAMQAVQSALIGRAADLLKPGGRLVYATCSLEREEGEGAVAAALDAGAPLRVEAIGSAELPGLAAAVTPDGYLRTRPDMAFIGSNGVEHPGMDGFFAARLIRC